MDTVMDRFTAEIGVLSAKVIRLELTNETLENENKKLRAENSDLKGSNDKLHLLLGAQKNNVDQLRRERQPNHLVSEKKRTKRRSGWDVFRKNFRFDVQRNPDEKGKEFEDRQIKTWDKMKEKTPQMHGYEDHHEYLHRVAHRFIDMKKNGTLRQIGILGVLPGQQSAM